MSKTSLKKELKELDGEQVKEMILDLYTRCKEAREYLDFFLEPEVQPLFDKHYEEISKEAWRGKYGKSTARVSRIKATLKHFDSFGAGPEWTLKLMHAALLEMLDVEYRRYVSLTFIKGINGLAVSMLKYAEKEQLFDKALETLNDVLLHYTMSKGVRTGLRDTVQDYLALAAPVLGKK